MTSTATYEKYQSAIGPDKDLFTLEDVSNVSEQLDHMATLSLGEWVTERTQPHELNNGQRYRMLIDRPSDGNNDKAVIVMGEFGNGLSTAIAARARIIRDMVDPAATLVLQPNTTLDEDNMNFSRQERRQLRAGSANPFIHRIDNVLCEMGTFSNLTLVGPSQGGTVALSYAAHPDTRKTATAVIEIPDVKKRHTPILLSQFATGVAQLPGVINENFNDPSKNALAQEFGGGKADLMAFVRYGVGLARADNRVLRGIMRRETAGANMRAALEKQGSIVDVWGTAAYVSPAEWHRENACQYIAHPRFNGVEVSGADHSITNLYVMVGAAARRAQVLLGVS